MQASSCLKFVRFKEFILWDVKRFVNQTINSKFRIVLLGQHIIEQNKKFKLFESPNDEFKILGVNNQEGIFDAYLEYGNKINQAYKKMNIGDLAYNPYRINVGSIGLKTELHNNDYISPAYVVFSCKNTLLPDFLYKMMKSDSFNKVIRDNTTGSVRQNLTYDILTQLKIPLPNVDIQQDLLDEYYDKINSADELEKKADELEKQIETYLQTELGIEIMEAKTEKKGLKFVRFGDLDRWGGDYLKNRYKVSFLKHGKYKTIEFGKIINFIQYGLSEKANTDSVGIPMLRMNNINKAELFIDNLKHIKISDSILEKTRLDKNDLLFNRTNSKELVGKTAVFELDGVYTFASYLIRIKVNETLTDVKYINYYLNSKLGRYQIDLTSRQVLGQANINSQEIQDFIIPLPSLEEQKKIADTISSMKEQIKTLRLDAENLKVAAKEEFEKELFN